MLPGFNQYCRELRYLNVYILQYTHINVPCSRTQHGAACGDRTQDLSNRSLMLYHYATALPLKVFVTNLLVCCGCCDKIAIFIGCFMIALLIFLDGLNPAYRWQRPNYDFMRWVEYLSMTESMTFILSCSSVSGFLLFNISEQVLPLSTAFCFITELTIFFFNDCST